MEAELAYYQRRVAEERAAAATSVDRNVRAIHAELAKRYEEQIAALNAEQRRSQMHLVSAA